MRLLHISLNTTHSECKPSSSISSFTHSLQVFPAPTRSSHPCHHHIPTGRHPISTLTLHMPKPPQSTMPYHLSHALSHKRLYKSPLCFLSFSDNPHNHFTIIRSVLSFFMYGRIRTFCRQCLRPCRSFEFGFIILQSTADMPRGLMAFEEFFKILTSYKPGNNTWRKQLILLKANNLSARVLYPATSVLRMELVEIEALYYSHFDRAHIYPSHAIVLTLFLWDMPADTTETVVGNSAWLQPSANSHATVTSLMFSCSGTQRTAPDGWRFE